MNPQRVLVTGSDGRIGRAVVQDLREHGYLVTPADRTSTQGRWSKIIDCEDLGQVVSMMRGHAAVIHLAAIPSPMSHPVEVVYRNNVVGAYNILEAAAILGIQQVVMASSISALGFAFHARAFNPLYLPIDESHPLLSQDAYGLSKMAGEQMAEGFCRRIPELGVASLRFTFVMDEHAREHYLNAPQNRPPLAEAMANNWWTYVDIRDTAESCRLALEARRPGHEAYFINAPEILVDEPVEDLIARFYPGDYPVAADLRGRASPVDCGKAERLLGWKARYNSAGEALYPEGRREG